MERAIPWTTTAPGIAVAFSIALAGCVAGPNFTRPVPPAADRYTTDTLKSEDESAGGAERQRVEFGKEGAGDWWLLFRSPAIDAIVREAVAHNQTLAEASATLQQARETARAVAGSRYPQVALSAGVGRQKYGDEFLGGFADVPPFTYFAVGPIVSYNVDYTGGTARAIERQIALSEVSRHQLDAAYLTISGRAVLQALMIASSQAQIASVQTVLRQDEDNLKLVQRAFDEGSVPRADVVSARSQLATDMTRLPPLRQELSEARHALSLILGRPPADPLPAELDLASIELPRELPVSLPSELVHRRPDILMAEAALHAATSAVGVADSNLYPKIQLTATGGQQALAADALFNRASTAWSLISGLTAPIFDGGTLHAQKRASEAALRASAAHYQETVLEAFGQVADALEALDHDAEQLEAQESAQDAAQSNLDLARASYKEGNAGILQVLDAERQYEQGRLGYVRALAQRYLDTVQLFLALGGTSPSPPTPLPAAS
jgi:NodT family efflux transporter outer membrane factor (OMF) lipoprotein